MKAFFEWLLENLLKFSPIGVIKAWQRGIRLTLGHIGKELEPGLYWKIPFVQEVIEEVVNEATVDLPNITITLADESAVEVSANVTYDVSSVKRMWLTMANPRTMIALRAAGELSRAIQPLTWDEAWESMEDTCEAARKKLAKKLRRNGVRVKQVDITTMAKTRAYTVFNGAASPIFMEE